ncbi:MAG TPA: allantoate amidohydrolase [Candidatus Dormibacteraeota bacterium]
MGRDASVVMRRCDVLGSISEEPDRLTRPFGSDAMRRAHEQVTAWMREAGMSVSRDNMGNLRGRYEGEPGTSRTLLIGSHLDSVRDAGKYDGPLGVLVAIAAVQAIHDRAVRLPFAIEVVGFADEEGLRFGTPYLGSKALAGAFDQADRARIDSGGMTMADAIRAFGGDPQRIAEDRWNGGDLLGYFEVHIEQGPVLEGRGLPVGVVSAIAGQSRFELTFTGEAAHAGTTPMDRRKDALVAASVFVQAVDGHAAELEGLVATVGQLTVQPGAANVVPGEVTLSLDVRHSNDADRLHASQLLLDVAEKIADHRGIALTTRRISENSTVPCSPPFTSILAHAVEDRGHTAIELASGAGHDAVVMAGLTEIAMLFVRCKGGISHNPAESVAEADVAVALDVLGRFLELMAAEP